MSGNPIFYNPLTDTKITRNRLPHWQQNAALYFVTFRTADSIPAELMVRHEREKQEWLQTHPQPWTDEIELEYHVRFSGRIEEWLDQGHGACVLRQSTCAAAVANVLCKKDETNYRLHAWVIMPNHVHVLAELDPSHDLADVIQGWKGASSLEINRLLGQTGSFWQKSYYDRIVRDWQHLGRCVRYIRANPLKAKLHTGEFLHGESELARNM